MSHKFKIGDIVKLISNIGGSFNHIGDVGTIGCIQTESPLIWYQVNVLGGPKECNWSLTEDLIKLAKLNKNIEII